MHLLVRVMFADQAQSASQVHSIAGHVCDAPRSCMSHLQLGDMCDSQGQHCSLALWFLGSVVLPSQARSTKIRDGFCGCSVTATQPHIACRPRTSCGTLDAQVTAGSFHCACGVSK